VRVRAELLAIARGTSVAHTIVSAQPMAPMSVSVNDGFDRLERLLLAMQIGDELRPSDAADETGLSADVCLTVLLGLERAGLMTRGVSSVEPDRFVRRRLELGS
jgi:hypothetical protein